MSNSDSRIDARESEDAGWSMPAWGELIERYDLSELRGGADLVVKAGDIAVARTGDLMLGGRGVQRFVSMREYAAL